MAASVELATAWIKIVPTAQGVQGKLVEELAGPAEKAGDDAGKKSGRRFTDGWKGVAGAAAGVGLAAALMGGFGNAVEASDGKARMQAALAMTDTEAQRAGDVAGALYSNAYGDSMSGVQDAVGAVMSSMGGMRDASAADLQDITAKAMNLATAFDVDVAESTATAGALMKSGLAANADQAMDLITGSMQKIPAAVRGEVLPVMDEYSKHFAGLGIDGETAMGMIVAASADGAIGMDKMGDALKEFTIRSTDMSKSTTDAYKDLGLNADEMTSSILKGGPSANKAMSQVVNALSSVKDPGKQAALSLALFGTPLEDLGTDQIPNFLGMIDPMGDKFDSTAGAADSLGKTLGGGPSNALKSLSRSFESMFTSVASFALPAITSFANFVAQNQWVIPVLATAIGVGLVAAFVAWAASVWAANAALLANPVTWIVLGIIALIAAIVLLVMNWDTVVSWATQVWGGFVNWLVGILNGFLGWWNGLWGGIVAWWQGLWAGVASWWNGLWNGIIGFVRALILGYVAFWLGVWNGVISWFRALLNGVAAWWRGLWNGIISFVRALLNAYVAFWRGVWTGIGNVLRTLISAAINFFRSIISNAISFARGIVGGFASWWNGIWSQVGATVRNFGSSVISFLAGIWNGMINGARNAISGVLGFFRGLPGQISGVFSGAGSWLMNAGRQIIDGLINGIRGMIGNVQSTLKNLTNLLPSWKGPPEKDATLLYGAGQLVIGGFQDGLEAQYGDVQASLGRFTNTLGTTQAPAYQAPAPATARGGLNVEINNPVPEPASRSIARTYAKVAYLGLDAEDEE